MVLTPAAAASKRPDAGPVYSPADVCAFRIAYRALKASGALAPSKAVTERPGKGWQRLGAGTSDPDLGHYQVSFWLPAGERRPRHASADARLQFYVEVLPYEGCVGRERFSAPRFFGPFTMDRHGLLPSKANAPLVTGGKVNKAGLAAVGAVAGYEVSAVATQVAPHAELEPKQALPTGWRSAEVTREVRGEEALRAFFAAHFDRSDFRELVRDGLDELRTKGDLDLARCMYVEAWRARSGSRLVEEAQVLVLVTRRGARYALRVE